LLFPNKRKNFGIQQRAEVDGQNAENEWTVLKPPTRLGHQTILVPSEIKQV